ncbi:KpsF/GutQ family sugar-phosphate isomerase [Thioalkalivibrio sp. HK1]|uniref:KpsF/GutQ family sugar-phosphate isomerase n=1 Tax=Thioalkalivibrio sp. HK1 TaxID=1469245 RepID=UPI000470B9F6|nr:KpsF/GutQ family sugar-phosphate isomerase [Thioalkalivibrio sp. HK1]
MTPLLDVESIDDAALRNAAVEALKIEARALLGLVERVDDAFVRSCRMIIDTRGKTAVIGVGKSGHIARKIAATLASTGTPALFVHAAEAMHGDLGMIDDQDAVIALSNSGESDEVLAILPALETLKVPLIALTGNPHSRLARKADVHLDVSVEREACSLNLIPTASTTAALAMGDALAVALVRARGFGSDDFARSHPGGKLGRRLLLRISDVMHTGDDIPKVRTKRSLADALVEMTRSGLGMTVVVDIEDRIIGILTDGDLRRALARDLDLKNTPIDRLMTPDCISIAPDRLATEAARLMRKRAINALPVVDACKRVVGALNMHDLLRARIL